MRVISNDIGAKYICDDTEIFDYFSSITDTFISRNKRKHLCEEKGMSQKDIYEAQCSEKPVFIFISDIVSFIDGVYHPQGNISNMSGFFENIFEKGYLHNIYFFAEINTDNLSTVSGSRVYQLFTSYKTGVHIGGNVASQRIFNFQNIGYSQMSKTSKKGYGLVPSENDETIAESIVIPLVGGFS